MIPSAKFKFFFKFLIKKIESSGDKIRWKTGLVAYGESGTVGPGIQKTFANGSSKLDTPDIKSTLSLPLMIPSNRFVLNKIGKNQ